MSIEHARLKAHALLSLDKFIAAFTSTKKHKILTNKRIDMTSMLKMDEYVELNNAIADLNKFIVINSTPEKLEKASNRIVADHRFAK